LVQDDTNDDKDTVQKKSKFGSLQNSNIGGGPKSVRSGFSTATTEVAFSNYAYPKAEDQEEGAVLMKVRGKPGILKKHLAIIPGLTMMLTFSGVDVLQSSAQLLSDPSSYALTPARAAVVNINSMTYGILFSCFVTLFGGVMYDLLGRRSTVSIMFLTGAGATALIPFGKDLTWGIYYFNVTKNIFFATMVPLLMNPFINDYVKVQDRGLAMGLQNFGLTIGNLLSVGVLYTLTSMLNAEVAFPVLSVLQIAWVVIILTTGMIQEPN